MKTRINSVKAAIVLITFSFSLMAGANESPVQSNQEPQNETEPAKTEQKGPVYSPLKVKPYTKRTYRA